MSAALIGPQPVGTEMFTVLTADELWVLRMHLASGWYKQGVVYPPAVDCDLWQETSDTLDDCHRAHDAFMDGTR